MNASDTRKRRVSEGRRAQAFFWAFAATALAVDQSTKWVVFREAYSSREYEVLPGVFFRLSPTGNTGVAWGFFGRWPAVVLVVGLIAAAFVVYYFYKSACQSRAEGAVLGMILGGAFGNVVDRIFVGHVRDFLDFRLGSFSWPTFNAADTFISTGAGLLILMMLVRGGETGGKGAISGEKGDK